MIQIKEQSSVSRLLHSPPMGYVVILPYKRADNLLLQTVTRHT